MGNGRRAGDAQAARDSQVGVDGRRTTRQHASVAEPSEQLLNFALFALDHAAESVIASGGPLVPFAITEAGGQRQLARFPGDLEEGQQQARTSVRSAPDAELAAVAWDGYLTVGGERADAVFVEASGRSDPESVLIAQRYRIVGRLKKRTQRVGNAAVVGSGLPLI